MPKGGNNPTSGKKEEQGSLDRIIHLAPLFALILQALELALKLLGVIE